MRARLRWLPHIGAVIGLGLALLLLGACGASQSEPPAQTDAARGASLWAQSVCVGCHGLLAEGSTAGPALIDTPLTLHDVIDITRRGGPGMPHYPPSQISDQDLGDMYAWFLNPVPAPTPEGTLGQNPWAQSACAGCHGSSAQGGSGPSLAGTSRPFASFQATVRRGARGMPAFSQTQVSDQMLRAIYDWLQAQGGAEVPHTQPAVWTDALCGACHGANAEGASGPALTGEGFSFDEFQRVVREGAEGMPAYDVGRVSDADLRAMYDWLMALHH
jgi:mono/diheme cytochrome c family protein